mgnify:CR=1 FL=1
MILFIHGNRDFLCGQEFALRSNLTLLPDPFFINFFDQKIALSHGDDFCTNDHQYIEFKKEVRSQKWQDTFLKKTLDERLKIASNMRDASQTNNTKYHNAFNGGEENRIHLVACVLDYKFN